MSPCRVVLAFHIMYVATLPFFPLVKAVYDIEKIKPSQQIMKEDPQAIIDRLSLLVRGNMAQALANYQNEIAPSKPRN